MLRASRVSALVYEDNVPVFTGTTDSVKAGMIPGGSLQNLEFVDHSVRWKEEMRRDKKIILADAQTSGGLLISMPAGEAEKFLSEVIAAGCPGAGIIGEITQQANLPVIHIK